MNDLLLKKLEECQYVYHYTSIEALFSILEGYRNNIHTGLIPFRASCIYNVNDPREMELGYDAVAKFLPQYEKNVEKNMHLCDVYNDCSYKDFFLKEYLKKNEDGLIETGNIPYIISLSENRDFLPMWTMYGCKSKGVCIKFNLCRLFENLLEGTQIDFVSYDGENEDYIMNEHFSTLYNWVTRSSKKKLSIEEKKEELSILCLCISPFIKSNDWAYEKEFRIVYNKHYGPNLEHDYLDFSKECIFQGTEKEKVDHYYVYPINSSALEEIIIGSLVDYKVLEHILKNELKDCLLDNVDITPSSILFKNK